MRYLTLLLALLRPHRARIAASALAIAIGATLTFTIDTIDPDGAPAQAPLTITLGGPGHEQLQLGDQAREHARELAADPAEHQLREQPPAATAPETLQRHQQLQPDGQPEIPDRLPLAAAHVPGCETKLVRNYSSRNGSPVLLGVIHGTQSPPTLGWAGVLANVRWFDTAASQASSNEIMSRDGKCALAVPEAAKAWTQAGFNPVAVSVEIVTDFTPPTLMTETGRWALARLLLGWHQRWGIPLQRAIVSGCSVLRPGMTDHKALGACGGGHVDVKQYDVDQVIADARTVQARQRSPLTARERRIAAGTRRPAGTGHSRRYWCTRSVLQRRTIIRTARRDGWDRNDRRERRQALRHAARSC